MTKSGKESERRNPSTNITDDVLLDSLKKKEQELEKMQQKEENAKKKEKAQKPMINKTNKMILCAVIFGLLVIACMATPAGLGLAAVAIATAGVGAYGLATAVKGGMKSYKGDPIKEAKKEVRDKRIEKIREGLGKDNDGQGVQESNTQAPDVSEEIKGILESITTQKEQELEKIQEKILKNAKEVLGKDFEIEDNGNNIKLFEGDNFEKFIENLSAGLKSDSRNISPSDTTAIKGQGELFKEFVQAYKTTVKDNSEKKLRLEGLKDIFKDWSNPNDSQAVSKKDAAKNMLNKSSGKEGDALLKPEIEKAEEKVKSKAQAKAATRSTSQTTGGGRV